MLRHIPLTLSALLCLELVLATPVIAENKRAKAKRLFDEGATALEDHNYRRALEAFEEAYETSPHWMVLAHIGTCHAKLNDPVKAIWALEKYLEEGGSDIQPSEREAARKLLTEQKAKVGVLRLIVDLPQAEGRIDGDAIGRAPFDRLLLKAGPHHLIVLHGNNMYEKDFTITAGGEIMIRLPEDERPPVHESSDVIAPIIKKGESGEQAPTMTPQKERQEPSPIPEWPQEKEDAEDALEPVSDLSIFPDDHPNGVSVPFYVALGFSAAGAITGVIGWSLFGHYSKSEQNFADALSDPRYDPYDWETTCADTTVNTDTCTGDLDVCLYFCNNESKRRNFASKKETALIPAIAGTAVAVAAGGTALLFYFHPEWFVSEDRDVSLSVVPVATASQTGLSLVGTF